MPSILSTAKSVVSTVTSKKELSADQVEELQMSAQNEIIEQDNRYSVSDPKYEKVFKIRKVFQQIRDLQEKAMVWDMHVQSVVSTQDTLCAG